MHLVYCQFDLSCPMGSHSRAERPMCDKVRLGNSIGQVMRLEGGFTDPPLL